MMISRETSEELLKKEMVLKLLYLCYLHRLLDLLGSAGDHHVRYGFFNKILPQAGRMLMLHLARHHVATPSHQTGWASSRTGRGVKHRRSTYQHNWLLQCSPCPMIWPRECSLLPRAAAIPRLRLLRLISHHWKHQIPVLIPQLLCHQ